jgi:transcriptional regulator with XRE-family HTH domain
VPVTGQRVVRRTLARRLTRLRQAAGMSRKDVAEAPQGVSEATLHRIENGKTPVTPANVRALCWLYGVDQSHTDALAELAIGTSHEEWWEANPVIPDWFKLYLGLEASAQQICVYECELVPGELQTEEYAMAVFRAAKLASEDEARRHVTLRQQRQQAMFARRPAPRLITVLGQSALSRPVGGPDVMKAQLEFLRSTVQAGHAEIRVLPYSVGAHAAMAGPFRIVELDDPEDPEIVYLESHVGALYLEEPEEVSEYRRIFELVHTDSVPLDEFS